MGAAALCHHDVHFCLRAASSSAAQRYLVLLCGTYMNSLYSRFQNQYEKHKEVVAAQGVKILGKDLEKTLAGLPLLVAHKEDEVPVLKVRWLMMK